jgi:iron complex outermembrane receptor protein
VGNSPTISLIPGSRTLELFSAFVQDEITLVPNRLRLTLGSKFEHNDFTGFEIQPSGRLLWTPRDNQSVWASVSRAVRTPSRSEDDVVLNQPREVAPGLFLPITITGNQDMDSEKLLAYEIGYRSQPWEQLSFDLATFYNDYDQLRSLEQDPSSPTVLHPGNKLYGEAYGVELSGLWEIARWWRVRPAYTFLEVELHTRPGSTDTTSQQDEGKSPRHQFTLRSSMDLPHNLFLDGTLRYVDSLPALKISSYVELDVRLGWRPTSHLELAIGGQNLLDSQHAEFSPSFIRTQQTEAQRGVYGKITWRF